MVFTILGVRICLMIAGCACCTAPHRLPSRFTFSTDDTGVHFDQRGTRPVQFSFLRLNVSLYVRDQARPCLPDLSRSRRISISEYLNTDVSTVLD